MEPVEIGAESCPHPSNNSLSFSHGTTWSSVPRSIRENEPDPDPVFLNVYGAQESIPRNEFRQSMKPGGPVR
jgi:hypothetical protein